MGVVVDETTAVGSELPIDMMEPLDGGHAEHAWAMKRDTPPPNCQTMKLPMMRRHTTITAIKVI
jgi:hypothetical protein